MKNPQTKMYSLPPNCDIPEINVGTCDSSDSKTRCLHPNQLQGLQSQECSDPLSNYCCGPIETAERVVNCRTPNMGGNKFSTYKIPVTEILQCGCIKC